MRDMAAWSPAHEAEGWALLLATYAACYVAAAWVPVAALTPGYVIAHATPGRAQLYRLNGFSCLLLLVALAAALVRAGALRGDVLYTHFWACARASCALGLALAAWSYARGRALLRRGLIDRRARCPTVDDPAGGPAGPASTAEFDSRGALAHFYCGLSEYNPAGPWGVDVKMWLYLVGALQLQLNLLSAVYHAHAASAPAPLSPGLVAYAGCLSFFVVEYVFNEEVHTLTYDIFRERLGFKLIWGCVCFYPFFYVVGVWPLCRADAAPLSPAAAAGCCALFACGWLLTRGANAQKFACKRKLSGFLWGGLVPMTTLPGSKGRILISGFWGVSRHVNYAGEVLQALALALPGVLATGDVAPLLYPAYYLALFIPRALDDDAQCRAKYGAALWGAYTAAVPWRIVPWVY